MKLNGLTADESKNLLLSVGTYKGRRPLSPVEIAVLFQKAINHGASKKMCAQFVHLNNSSMVSRFLKLLELSPLTQLSTDWGQTELTISFSSAWQLSCLSKDEQEISCREIITNQLRSKEVQQVVQLRKRSGRTLVECLNEVVGMRPTVTRIHLILGTITNTDVQEKLSNLSQIERDNLFRDISSVMYRGVKKLSGRLGTNRFSIVTDEHGINIICPKQDSSFEDEINQELANRMIGGHD